MPARALLDDARLVRGSPIVQHWRRLGRPARKHIKILRNLGISLLVALLVVGCGHERQHAGGNAPPSLPAPQSSGLAPVVQRAEQALETFWSAHLSSVTTAQWSAPANVDLYTNHLTPTGSGCLPEGSPEWQNNSFYCTRDHVIYLDTDWLEKLGGEFPANPEIAPVIIQAHEFGHHLQFLADATFHLDIGKELQADCYAGVFLDALANGDVNLDIGAVDVRGALDTIRGIADTSFVDDNWFTAGTHGGPPERAPAMATGYLTGDASFCSAYEVTGPIKPVSVGGYTVRPPPATSIQPLQNGVFRLTSSSRSELTVDLQNWTGVDSGAVDALTSVAPNYFKSAMVHYIGNVEDFGQVADYKVSNLRYVQTQGTDTYHGVLVLVTRGDGTALLVDVYETGPAPTSDSDPDWTHIGNYAFSTLWGITG